MAISTLTNINSTMTIYSPGEEISNVELWKHEARQSKEGRPGSNEATVGLQRALIITVVYLPYYLPTYLQTVC